MSIYANLSAPDSDSHEDDCNVYVERDSGVFELTGECDCGQPDAPLIYQGSHVLPSEDDERGGYVDISLIPAHVRWYRDNPDAPAYNEPEGAEPFLRLGVNDQGVVLTRRNVEQIHATLTEWLELTSTVIRDQNLGNEAKENT